MAIVEGTESVPAGRPGIRALLAATVLYAACLVVATYPAAAHLRTAMPSAVPDPLMHLWVMRWYKVCLLEGRAPVVCPDLQYPTGAPLGHFSPMHLQALLYLPLSFLTSNDIFCYNVLWFFGFLTTGVGTCVLAWWVLRDQACAWFAGLVAMLSGPLMLHAHAHLELLYVGAFPLFLVAWLRFVDGPSRGRLAAAAGTFLLLTMGAAYFLVLAIPPAALYVGWRMGGEGRSAWLWLKRRLSWLAGFALAVLPPLLLLFAGQFWAIAHGHSLRREHSQFEYYAAPLWAYWTPTENHRLGTLLPFNVYAEAGYSRRAIESVSYLGIVTLFLIHRAAVRRVRFPRVGYWWAAFGLLVVLSMGSTCRLGPYRVPLPGALLWHLPAFQLIRNPARFNLLATICAAVLAAAGLRQLLADCRRPWARSALIVVLSVLVVADLGVGSFTGSAVPAMPACYRALTAGARRPALLEAPLICSGAPWHLTASCGYWQSIHRAKTTAGYSGHDNDDFDYRLYISSPFAAPRLADPGYLLDPEAMGIDMVRDVRFDDYVWLYINVHRFDYVVLHQWPGSVPETPVRLDRLKARLHPALVAEDSATAVYDPSRLSRPIRPVLLAKGGWLLRSKWRGGDCAAVARVAELAAYNPEPDRELTLTMEAEALRKSRTVRLRFGSRELARWTVQSGRIESYVSPPFRLPAGLQDLTIESDGQERPVRRHEAIAEGDDRPYSLRVASVRLTSGRFDPAMIVRRGDRGRGQ
jgi:hypothetical protein